ncbi:hypothetical protein L1987_70388 [Smallanthus sonchifolius]|uniref:Uncharacterized protein n=1 Tax=Smallanthus sonchifolius TaxID=185202 RepID=A0ACB9AQC4_9ASTR|nr:hypothetical protein L1987_70388 [Smallanthus sonchifolius]
MVVLHHEHPLSLKDLNPKYPQEEVVYDDEEDLIFSQNFEWPCGLCDEKITYFHRYYHKCDECDYSLHDSCAKLQTTLEHPSHEHALTLFRDESEGKCHVCKSIPQYNKLRYHCSHSHCMFNICLDCGVKEVHYHTIYHPSHQHPLVTTNRQISAQCDACGKEHKGVFYQCTTCFRSCIHNDCVFRPKRLLIQDGTCKKFVHPHLLVLTYSFPKVDQEDKDNPTCMVCDNSFSDYENLWVYKCEKCRYYTHLDCAFLRGERSESGKSNTYYHDVLDA